VAVAADRLKVAQVIRATMRERQNVIALARWRDQVVNPQAVLTEVVVSGHRELAVGVILGVVSALVRGAASLVGELGRAQVLMRRAARLAR
jgi:hypothetical protein